MILKHVKKKKEELAEEIVLFEKADENAGSSST